jgi:hypothetical protein
MKNAGEKPPVLGMIQRNGEVVLHMLENVQRGKALLASLRTLLLAPGNPD